MSFYIEGIYYDDLQSAVPIPQQWSAMNWKAKDLVVAQSHKASRQRRKSKSSFFQCPYVGLQQKVWPRLKVCATTPGPGTCFVLDVLELRDLPVLIFWNSQTLCLNISMPRSRSETQFWIVVHSRFSQADNQE